MESQDQVVSNARLLLDEQRLQVRGHEREIDVQKSINKKKIPFPPLYPCDWYGIFADKFTIKINHSWMGKYINPMGIRFEGLWTNITNSSNFVSKKHAITSVDLQESRLLKPN